MNKEKADSHKRTFRLLVVENESSFYETLLEILSGCMSIFPFLKFEAERYCVKEGHVEPELKPFDLIFIEDVALENIKRQEAKTDFVLLLTGYFFRDHAIQIKKMISKKSLNLYEHISLTNYSFDLIKLLVVDFIKSKVKCSNERKTPNLSLLSYWYFC